MQSVSLFGGASWKVVLVSVVLIVVPLSIKPSESAKLLKTMILIAPCSPPETYLLLWFLPLWNYKWSEWAHRKDIY